jgi:hypothetical protein
MKCIAMKMESMHKVVRQDKHLVSRLLRAMLSEHPQQQPASGTAFQADQYQQQQQQQQPKTCVDELNYFLLFATAPCGACGLFLTTIGIFLLFGILPAVLFVCSLFPVAMLLFCLWALRSREKAEARSIAVLLMFGCVGAIPVIIAELFLIWTYGGFDGPYGAQDTNATVSDPWEGIGAAGYSAWIVAGVCEEIMK